MGIDLSVGSVVALTTVLVGTLVAGGRRPLLAFCIGLAMSVSFGAMTEASSLLGAAWSRFGFPRCDAFDVWKELS
ncbi:hypothetical protein [Sorangium sp. So ce131]|uniref:hypothetical protein n=1 Tax=Sorangium sp. So ce131 TaxID=3133282 RepID=UPI003F613869